AYGAGGGCAAAGYRAVAGGVGEVDVGSRALCGRLPPFPGGGTEICFHPDCRAVREVSARGDEQTAANPFAAACRGTSAVAGEAAVAGAAAPQAEGQPWVSQRRGRRGNAPATVLFPARGRGRRGLCALEHPAGCLYLGRTSSRQGESRGRTAAANHVRSGNGT